MTDGSGYPYGGHADKALYAHSPRADKDFYLHDDNIQCLIQCFTFPSVNVQVNLEEINIQTQIYRHTQMCTAICW